MMQKQYKYSDLRPLTAWAATTLALAGVAKLFAAVEGLMRFRALAGVEAESANSNELVENGLVTLAAGGSGFAWMAAWLVFFVWAYRASANVRSLGVESMPQSPCWSWLNFMIPVWRLFMPLVFFRNLLRVSLAGAAGLADRWAGAPEIKRCRIAIVAVFVCFAASALVVDAIAWTGFQNVVAPALNSGSAEAVQALAEGVMPTWFLKAQSVSLAAASVMQAVFAFALRYFLIVITAAQTMWRDSAGRRRDDDAAAKTGFGWPGMRT